MATQEKKPEIKGIFSTSTTTTLGFGTTKKKSESKIYWFGKEADAETMEVKELGSDFKPHGEPNKIDKKDFFKNYTLEPELWYKQVNQKINKGDLYRQKNMMHEAQIEYTKATIIDEDNIRANFGLGLVYLSMDMKDKAEEVCNKIMDIDETFEEKHKHLFNEFGIKLRKKGLYDSAIKYYNRALKLAGEDDHLHFNLARAYYSLEQTEKSFDHLRMSMELDPESKNSKAFLKYMLEQGIRPSTRINHFFLKSLATIKIDPNKGKKSKAQKPKKEKNKQKKNEDKKGEDKKNESMKFL